jgi:hypothetical protein
MPLHSILGYVVVAIAGAVFALALVALLARSRLLDRLAFYGLILCVVAQVLALVTGIGDNAGGAVAAALVAPYNFFLGASMFTLSAGLAVWRWFNPGVAWDQGKWLLYLAGGLGNLALGVALAIVGRLAAGA